MHPYLGPVAGLLVALAWTDVAAQQPACTLLTPADIETITGAKAMEPHPLNMTIPEGPQKGQPMNGCMWGVAGNGMVSVSTMPYPKDVSPEDMAKLEQVYGELKAQQWTQERKDFPGGSCSIMTPPPSKKDSPILSGCITQAKGMVISSSFMSPTVKLSMDQTRALMDKAVSRMH